MRTDITRTAENENITKIPHRDILLLIPTLNEEKGLGEVLQKARRIGLRTIVLDGGSTDQTKRVARSFGVPIITAPRGKGRAFRSFIHSMDKHIEQKKYLAMIDGDGTYDLTDLKQLQKISNGDMIIGQRVYQEKTFNPLRIFGNHFFNWFFSIIHKTKTPDLLSGFRLIKIELLKDIDLIYDEFELETELTASFLKDKKKVTWIPVNYYRRKGNSKLKPWQDGLKIFLCIVKTKRD